MRKEWEKGKQVVDSDTTAVDVTSYEQFQLTMQFETEQNGVYLDMLDKLIYL